MKVRALYKKSVIGLGWVFVGLGVVGIFVPLMPATPFFILAAGCFAKSSEKFYNWLINHPKFGLLIKNYRDNKGMLLKSKITAVLMLIITIGSSAIFFTENTFIRVLLVLIALSVSTYILSLKTVNKENGIISGEDE